MSGRQRLRALARGQGSGGIAVPLALATAARIQERDWQEFLEDPTQLANGLRDLHQAVGPDGLAVTAASVLVDQSRGGLGVGRHAVAAVEAVRRLRASLGDVVALVAPVPGPTALATNGTDAATAAEEVQAFGKELLAAGVDVILVLDDGPAHPSLSTLDNMARFHQAVVAVLGEAQGRLVGAQRQSLHDPRSGDGLVVTDADVPREADITLLVDWVDAVQS